MLEYYSFQFIFGIDPDASVALATAACRESVGATTSPILGIMRDVSMGWGAAIGWMSIEAMSKSKSQNIRVFVHNASVALETPLRRLLGGSFVFLTHAALGRFFSYLKVSGLEDGLFAVKLVVIVLQSAITVFVCVIGSVRGLTNVSSASGNLGGSTSYKTGRKLRLAFN